MTGFRVGPQGVQGLTGIKPDITTLAKVIGGGMPIGAFGGRADVMNHIAPLGAVYQAGTLSGNPVAVAAGITTLKLLSEPGGFMTDWRHRPESSPRASLQEPRPTASLSAPTSWAACLASSFSESIPQSLADVSASNIDRFKIVFPCHARRRRVSCTLGL